MTADIDPRVIRRLADMHAVYRMWGHAGELLYIGKTGHLHRFDDHAVKRWFPMVSRITLEWHETEASAAVNERRAIQTERPRYNIAGTGKRRRLPVTKVQVAEVKLTPAAVLPEVPSRDVLADVLHVFGDAPGLHWITLAERLSEHFPDRWADVTKDALSAQCRSLGVPSVNVNIRVRAGQRKVLSGCRRDAVEKAAAIRVVAGR